ncbi:uncharacterized protein LOC143286350 [Babylonia areolata]|uniref:uncharacterized protein LOC143286350 n=1 Tax=Babylonia areolata TaxID=304850 RepID=UPI003FCF12E2
MWAYHACLLVVCLLLLAVCQEGGGEVCQSRHFLVIQEKCRERNDALLEAERKHEDVRLCTSLYELWYCVAHHVPVCFHNVTEIYKMYFHSPHNCVLTVHQLQTLQKLTLASAHNNNNKDNNSTNDNDDDDDVDISVDVVPLSSSSTTTAKRIVDTLSLCVHQGRRCCLVLGDLVRDVISSSLLIGAPPSDSLAFYPENSERFRKRREPIAYSVTPQSMLELCSLYFGGRSGSTPRRYLSPGTPVSPAVRSQRERSSPTDKFRVIDGSWR